MKSDKELDIGSIVRESFKNAMKTHGLIKEQEEQPRAENITDEDVVDYTAFIKFTPKDWAAKGTIQAGEIDSIVDNISGGATGGIQRYVNCLNNMNRLLGVKLGAGGMPVRTGDELGNLSEIVSALQLRMLVYNIISQQSPQSAGKIFEGLVARMVGGYGANDEDQAIEDLVDDKGNYISLKVIDETTDVKGSKYNLAVGIADRAGEGLGVTYLVCVKDKRNDPFSMRTISFTINSKNYFNFICGKANPTPQEIENAKKSIITQKQKESFNRNLNEISYGPSSEAFNKALEKYAEEEGIYSGGDVAEEIRKKFEQYYEAAKPKTPQETELYDKYLFIKDGDKVFNYESLKDAIPRGKGGANILKKNAIYAFKKAYDNLRSLNKLEKAKIFEDRPEIRKIYDGTDQRAIDVALKNNETKYGTAFKNILTRLSNLNTFVEKVDRIANAAEQTVPTAKDGKTPITQTDVTAAFFNDLKSGNFEKAKNVQTQFKISLPAIVEIAKNSEGSNYSEEYPTIVIDKATVFVTAEENNKLIKDWYTPVYKKFFKVDADLKNFYIKKQISGLSDASASTQDLKKEIDSKVEKAKEMGAKETPDIKAQQMQENKQKPLTKHWSDIMLEELLND